jgi:hypothetical protein
MGQTAVLVTDEDELWFYFMVGCSITMKPDGTQWVKQESVTRLKPLYFELSRRRK